MFGFFNSLRANSSKAVLDALGASIAIIEFDPRGKVLGANDNFLRAMGYELSEIVGRHHSQFCDPALVASDEYRDFWSKLGRGDFHAGEYRRLAKGGRELWIQASYNPVRDRRGNVVKVVKQATDITAAKLRAAETDARMNAISRVQAVIEFLPSGEIVSANENFLATVGYGMDEIKGQHHRVFVDPAFSASAEYGAFWQRLNNGEYVAGEFKRIGKGGREIWIQASYNPIFDLKGKVSRVVKFATDITAAKLGAIEMDAKLAAISRSQAVIEFLPSGEIVTANDNFLAAMGYRLEEIRGQHHRVFVDPAFSTSGEYSAFWQRLNNGEYVAAEFKRVAKGGREIWIQASYNPIFDPNGKVVKVVKFASDVTERVMSARKLAEAMAVVTESSHAIQTGTQEISVAVDDLARRTETQAASLEETAAALSEITSTVKKTAESAGNARTVVASARTDAEHSGEVVEKAVTAMGNIEASSRQVGQIIGVIDEIAFQTNLLALNAGVEAARAGDAGRGFAVVASEVRSLAQRSAEAAKEIKSLISASGRQVDEGVLLVKETGSALQRIVRHVNEISDIVAVMATSAHEQATALSEVNVAVGQMDQVTQQNAAMVEQTAAASRSLAQETENLNRLVNSDAPAQPAPARPAPARPAPRQVMLKTVGRGGAQRKAEPQSDGWEEF